MQNGSLKSKQDFRQRLAALEDMSWPARQFWIAIFALLLLGVFAASFYIHIESRLSGVPWTVVDSIYMVFITITTIGYEEVHDLSEPGRLFTVSYGIIGLIIGAFAAASAAQFLVLQVISEHVRLRRRLKVLQNMKNHYIICGFGRMGRETAHQLSRRGRPVVVIECNPDVLPDLSESGLPYVEGNATSDDILKSAGIDQAKALIAASDTDEDNLFIVLSARLLNPRLFIVSRAAQEATVDKLMRAGANRVHSPYVVGGRQLAAAAISPDVVDFLEMVLHHEDPDVEIAALVVPADASVVGQPMLESGVMQEGGAMILGVIDTNGKIHTNPRPTTIVNAGDSIIAMGSRTQLDSLKKAVKS